MYEWLWGEREQVRIAELVMTMVSLGVMGASVPKQETTVLYVPGLFGTPILVVRYCNRYESPLTGEVAYGTRGGEIFGTNPCITAVICAEIITSKPTDWIRRTIAPAIARSVFMTKFGISVRENPAGSDTIFNYIFDPRQANIGQTADIAAVHKAFYEHCAQYPNSQIVLFGDSRGAASVFNFVALHGAAVAQHGDIVGCICEGMFDSIPHILKHFRHWKLKGDWVERILRRALAACSHTYVEQGPFPIDLVDRFPRTMPLLLVTSAEDLVVPIECTLMVYSALRQRGYDKVHLLILPHSRHDSYMVGPDRDMYESCVHAFYRAYGITMYDAKKADMGEQFFAHTQPDVSSLSQQYELTRSCCERRLRGDPI